MRHVDPVEFLEVLADLTHRHAAHGHRHDCVVEVEIAALVLAISFGAKVPDRSRGAPGVDVCYMRPDRHFLIDTVVLRTRPKNLNGAGSVTTADLVRSTLRLRPDRIIVGEVRGPEALDMLKAWNTSHPGGIATVHANSALRALHRIEQLVQEAVVTVPRELIAGRSTSSCSSPDAGSTAALPPSPASTGSMRVVATRSPTSSSQPHPKEIIYDQVAHSFDRHGTCRRRTAAT